MTARQPNIILINCDDLGYGDIGPYGSTANRTPHLDRMAREGIRFTDFYMVAPVCSPSRAGMMTGCYPQRVGLGRGHTQNVLFPGDPIGLHPEEYSLGRSLKDAGYATCCIGKWHLGDQPPFLPTRHGFDHWFGLPYSNDMEPGNVQLIRNRGLKGMPPLPLMDDERVVETQPDQSTITQRYTAYADRFIREHRDEPFFCYFAHLYVHNPLIPPPDFLARSRNGPYGAEVECIDWSLGVLLKTLEELGIADETLILFTSDNGAWSGNEGSSNAPLRGEKGTTWEGGIRMPLLARWPGRIPAGGECREVITSMDLLPTLTALAGGELPSDRVIDGHNMTDLLTGEAGAESPYEYFCYYHADVLKAIRVGKWKLHLDGNGLYNLEADIGEQTDRIAAEPNVVARLQAVAEAVRPELGDADRGITGSGCRPCGRVDHPTTIVPMEPTMREAAYD